MRLVINSVNTEESAALNSIQWHCQNYSHAMGTMLTKDPVKFLLKSTTDISGLGMPFK